jgi:hypothetical protein
MLLCIQQFLLKTNAECCAARTLNAVAGCCCLLGVAGVECVAGAAGCLRRCCGCLPVVAGYGCLHCKKFIDFPVPTLQPECHKLNSPWPRIVKLFISVGC